MKRDLAQTSSLPNAWTLAYCKTERGLCWDLDKVSLHAECDKTGGGQSDQYSPIPIPNTNLEPEVRLRKYSVLLMA